MVKKALGERKYTIDKVNSNKKIL